MTTKLIFQRANNNRLTRLLLSIKDMENYPFNPKFNPNNPIYLKPIER